MKFWQLRSFIQFNDIHIIECSAIKFAENVFVLTHFHHSIGQNNTDKLHSHIYLNLECGHLKILTGNKKLFLVATY